MKTKSELLSDKELTPSIIDAIIPYIEQISDNYDELINIKIDLKQQKVYVLYNDYTEEKQALQRILSEVVILKQELENETDTIRRLTLQTRLLKLIDEYNNLKQKLNLTIELHDIV